MFEDLKTKVFADGADPTTATPLYTGTTDANGVVSFIDVPTGNYDVYEVLESGYFATDPSTGLKKDVTQTTAGTTVEFGNACYVDKTFTVTGVPTGVALELVYAINDGDNNGPYTTVDMTASGTSRSYTLADTLKPTDKVDWTYQFDGNAGSKLPLVEDEEGLSDYTDTSGIGTACAKTNTTAFPFATLSGTKYKDVDADGASSVDFVSDDAPAESGGPSMMSSSWWVRSDPVRYMTPRCPGGRSITGRKPSTSV